MVDDSGAAEETPVVAACKRAAVNASATREGTEKIDVRDQENQELICHINPWVIVRL
jgi:hypothetical protein